MLGKQIKTFYCMDCLADYLGCTVEDLLEKIEEFSFTIEYCGCLFSI